MYLIQKYDFIIFEKCFEITYINYYIQYENKIYSITFKTNYELWDSLTLTIIKLHSEQSL